jgi:molybdate transport system substrate-binding protein
VLLGEADAGIVYRTDVIGNAGGVSVVDIEPEFNVTAGYPIAVLRDAAHPRLGHEWISLLLSEQGRGLLSRAGFKLPKHEVTQ